MKISQSDNGDNDSISRAASKPIPRNQFESAIPVLSLPPPSPQAPITLTHRVQPPQEVIYQADPFEDIKRNIPEVQSIVQVCGGACQKPFQL